MELVLNEQRRLEAAKDESELPAIISQGRMNRRGQVATQRCALAV
jgi:hypothetical protein